MTDHLKVFAGFNVGDDCPMRYFHSTDGDIAFVYGGGRAEDVEVVFSRASLAAFLTLAERALTEGAMASG